MNQLQCFTHPVYRVVLLCTLVTSPLFAQTFTTLASFDGTDNSASVAGLIQATDGNLYGTTVYGGPAGRGTAFRITTSGTISTIYNFCSLPGCTDGAEPFAGLVQGTDGNLYGTTNYGGGSTKCTNGCGTVFKLTLSGTLTTLHRFNGSDGSEPQGGLTAGYDGNFYGNALNGGSFGEGSIYKVSPSGAFHLLHSFARSETDGGNPYTAPMQASDGNFYGAAYDGGEAQGGVIYKMTPAGTVNILYEFCPLEVCSTGAYPLGGLAEGTNGNLYGAAAHGGNSFCNDGCGTLFEITPGGMLTSLYEFCCQTGVFPLSAMTLAPNGIFYATTSNGGDNVVSCDVGCGTIYSLTEGGTFSSLYSFCQISTCPDGNQPQAGPLLLDTNGILYGTTPSGGASNAGTVFSYAVAGINPFVKPNPSGSAVGATVTILGTNLIGASAVTFNGNSASFTVVSASAITATVPSSATTGPIQVVTPDGTLTSNGVFRVLP